MLQEIEYQSGERDRIRHRGQRMIIVHSVGPRIAWFGRAALDLLFWDVGGLHRPGEWSLRGGHRLWITRPDADESEETYAADDRPCGLDVWPEGVVVTAPPDGARIEKSMSIGARDGAWRTEHRLRNTGEMLWAGGAWALTCTEPGRATR